MSCPVMQNPDTGERASGTVKAGGEDKPAPGTYIRWDEPGVETNDGDESEFFLKIAEKFNMLQLMSFNEHHHCQRATHPKTQGCIVGRFIVHENLPEHLAQGMFAKPGSYDCIAHYTSLTPKLLPDSVPAPRGFAMKVFGVKGEKLWGEDKETQDWTFNNYPILELRTPKVTMEIADAFVRHFDNLDGFAEEQKNRVDADIATRGGGLPRQHLVAMPQYSQGAYRHGDYVAKYGVFPRGQAQKDLENTLIQDSDPINVISQQVRDFHMKNRVTYSFCAQLLQDINEQPVEDTGIEWDEKKYPFEEIGHIEFEPQDSWLPQFRSWWDNRIQINNWHGLKVHRPLGGVQRVRRTVYAESRKMRLRVNGYTDFIEPKGLAEVPVPIPPPCFKLPYQHATNGAVAVNGGHA